MSWSEFPCRTLVKFFSFFLYFSSFSVLCAWASLPAREQLHGNSHGPLAAWPFHNHWATTITILDLTQLGHPGTGDLIRERSLCSQWSRDGKERSWHRVVCYIWRDMSEAGRRNICLWKSFSLSTLLWNSLIFTWLKSHLLFILFFYMTTFSWGK